VNPIALSSEGQKVLNFSLIGLVIAGFFVFNFGSSNFKYAGIQYAAFIIISIVFIFTLFKTGLTNIISIGAEYKKNIFLGIAFGVGFVLLNVLSPAVSIGYPNVDTYAILRFGIIVLLAPWAEELGFRFAFLNFMIYSLKIKPAFSILIQGVLFALYHFTVYGSILGSTSGAFIGALVFGITAGAVAYFRKSIVPGTIMHSIFNAWLLEKNTFSLIGV
jgi:membrane protease YdiL (CAAX protease family)